MSVVEVFPVFDRHLVVQVLDNLVTFLKSLESVKVSLCTLDALNRLLKLDLGASAFSSLGLDELLFLQVDDGALFLASLKQLFNLISRFLVLRCQLLFISLQLSQLAFDLQNSLIVIRYPVLLCAILRYCSRLLGWLLLLFLFRFA